MTNQQREELAVCSRTQVVTTAIPDRTLAIVFWGGVLACCAWILQLPVFPSEDGPVHMYYATVLAKLLRGGPGPLHDAFVIRHLLPPYSLYYYLLIALLSIFPAVLTEKLTAAILVITLAAGFRALCKVVGPNGRVVSLLILPVLLNWPLFMGFQNYVLSIGITLGALAVWFSKARKRRSLFLLLVAAVILAHPVPLAALVMVCVVDLFGRWWRRPRSRDLFSPAWRLDLMTLGAACVLMSYVALFTEGSKVRSNLLHHINPALAVKQYIALYGLGLFARISGASLLYTALLYCCLALAIVMVVRSFRSRSQHWSDHPQRTPADAMTVAILLFLLVLPFMPDTMNGGYYFNTRMLILAWCGLAASGAGGPTASPRWRALVTITSALALVVTLVLAQIRIVPTARRAALAEQVPLSFPGSNALLLAATAYQADPVLRFRPLE